MRIGWVARCTATGTDADWTDGVYRPTGCGWEYEGDDADRQAERHTKKTGHATTTVGRPDTGNRSTE